MFSLISAFIIIGQRVYFAIAQEKLLLTFAAKIYPKYKVPTLSIFIASKLFFHRIYSNYPINNLKTKPEVHMKNYKLTIIPLTILLALPIFLFGQNAHQKIQEMERERFTRMHNSLIKKSYSSEQSDFDVKYYRIELNIVPTTETINGNVTTTGTSSIDGLNQVTLDLFDNMQVDSVISNGESVNFTHTNNELIITLPTNYNVDESFETIVYYNGKPVSAGGFASFTFRQHQGVPIISTLSEPFGALTWWPCKDNPADKADSVDIIITVPDTLVVASNGKLISEIQNYNNTKTFHWAERYPISTYLISLAISNYETFSDYYHYSDTDSMEVKFYVYPEDLSNALEDFNVTVDIIDYFSGIFGLYPFINEKYGLAEFPWGGAMEHQTCTSYGEGLIRGDHWYDYINAHELSHQWFGDLITIKSWSHIWLNEGFASYSEALWAENLGGEPALFNYMNDFDQGLFPTSVFVYDSTNIGELFSRTVYDKGAWVLHMLRHVLGDTSFFNSLTNYRNNFAFANATTEDFRDICEIEFGSNLDWFFDQWIYGKYRPSYQYSWRDSIVENHHLITLTLDQVHTNTGLFKMPLDIKLFTLSGDTTFVVWDSLATQVFQFTMNEEVINLSVDPDGWLLKELLHDETISITGNVYGGDESTPVESAQIYFSRINLNMNTVVSTDTAFSDAHGKYAISVYPGFYIIECFNFEENYLPTEPKYMDITHNISNLNFVLISPKMSINLDSITVFLNEGESYTDTLTIENTGSGPLLFSIAPASSGGMLSKLSNYKPELPVKPILKNMPINSLKKLKKVQKASPPSTSSWQLLYKDPEDNAEGVFDVNETWMKISEGNLYLKVTTYNEYAAFSEFEYALLIDSDSNPNTGIPTGWLGVEYAIALGDYGSVYSVLVKNINGSFQVESFASYENFDRTNKEFTVAFPVASFGSAKVFSMIAQAVNLSNQFLDHDVVPDQNLGYFIFGMEDIPWLTFEPNFGFVESSKNSSVFLNIIPDELSAGNHDINLIVANNEFDNVPKIIPIKFDYITGIEKNQNLPKLFSLSQNYPNPFNSETLIHYDLPEQGKVTIDIYNLLGQKIKQLVDANQKAGSYSILWDGQDKLGQFVGTGIYFYVISLDNQTLPARKMVILK